MPINKSDIVFIGNAGGICGYMSHGINIIRKSTSLTGKRVKQDPAFKGFRRRCNRMKEASPIAASLYKLLPEEQKIYALYRTLTGEALKMLKQGLEKETVLARLKEQYIDPVIEQHLKQETQNQKVQTNTEYPNNTRNSPLFSKKLFRIHPYSRGNKRHLQLKGQPQYSNDNMNHVSHTEEYYPNEASSYPYQPVNLISRLAETTRKQKRISQFSELIYIGKCKDCKGLKMWLRPSC
ncbi:MAG TPA: hypothetical protein VGZ90_12290 [Puia sp.]|jgi:hypothetical protein|nr:hypothetical protein [Puia sp.]